MGIYTICILIWYLSSERVSVRVRVRARVRVMVGVMVYTLFVY